MFGENFERFVPEEEPAPAASAADSAKPADKAKKGKVAAKATGLQYQFQIMESMGVPREEIKNFADPYFWVKYYPPICVVSAFSPRTYICVCRPCGEILNTLRSPGPGRQQAVRLPHRLATLLHHDGREPLL